MTSKERYYWYKSHGICVQCGQKDAWKGQVLCLECRMSINENKIQKLTTEQQFRHYQHQKRRRDILIAFGICTVCGKRNAKENRRLCEICSAKYNNRQKEKSHEKGVMPNEILRDGKHCVICGAESVKSGFKVCEECYPKMRKNMLYARSCKKSENYFEKQNRKEWDLR